MTAPTGGTVADAPAETPGRPLLLPWLRLGSDGERLVVGFGGSLLALRGRPARELLPRLLPLCDGRRTLAEIAGELGDVSEGVVREAVSLLSRRGVLVEGPPRPEAPRTRTAELVAAATGAPLHVVAERLAAAVVAVVGESPLAAACAALLSESGVDGALSAGWPAGEPDLVVAVARPGEPAAADWNARAVAEGLPLLPVSPFDGWQAAVGPLVVPFETACLECLRLRRAACMPFPAEHALLEPVPLAAPSAPASDAVLAGAATLLALRWLGTGDPAIPGALFALGLGGELRLERHPVLRVPRCSACGPASPPFPWGEQAP